MTTRMEKKRESEKCFRISTRRRRSKRVTCRGTESPGKKQNNPRSYFGTNIGAIIGAMFAFKPDADWISQTSRVYYKL